jgi:type IV pilus assembly protein PilX
MKNVRMRESGAVLIVALVFLVILTMLGVTAMTGTTMELRMAGNARDVALALSSAEAALRDAENDLLLATYAGKEGLKRAKPPLATDYGASAAFGTCNNTAPFVGLCRPPSQPVQDAPLPTDLANISLSAAPSVAYGTHTGARTIVGVAQQPRYYIELLPGVLKPPGWASIGVAQSGGAAASYYRITARGVGANPNTNVTVSEVFVKNDN